MLPLSEHARFEMRRRGIPESIVQQVLEKPEQKIRLARGREIWQNRVKMEDREYVVRLVLELNPEIKIITVYRSSKINKYWREQ
ncbi:MAG: DUF4258 domain-containing protein [Deltaproteobacteria bacterium]|nr:DUF4258 domain-containing protein [Deltaproteobacteria bacterium]